MRRPRSLRPALAVALAGVVATTLTLAAGAVASADPERSSTGPSAGGPAARTGWDVVATGAGSWRVSWTAPTRLPATSDRPTITAPDGPVGVSTVRGDGRTVVADVRSARRPDVAVLDVLLSGDRLDEPGRDATGEAPPPAEAAPLRRRTTELGVDPAAPGEHDVVTSDYRLDPVRLRGLPEPVEMVGHVVEPAPDARTGPRPLVVFLHGAHASCYLPEGADGGGQDPSRWPCRPPFEEVPNHLGYTYLQRVLASQGYATVSIRANGVNAQDEGLDDSGAEARAALVRRHLDHWADLATEHQLDLDQVVLVGHSRGGEGVNRASIQVPLDAPYRIAGQLLLAPTDFGTQTAPYVPTVTVLPYCDGDVFDSRGQRYTDASRDLGLADDTALRSSVLVMGANHNFFNTEWTPGLAVAPTGDDWRPGGAGNTVCAKASPSRLTAPEQRRVGVAYVAGAVRLFTGRGGEGGADLLPLFDGSPVRAPSVGDAEVLSHALGGGRVLRRPGVDTGLSAASGADSRFCRGVVSESSPSACVAKPRPFGQVPHFYDAGEFAPSRKALDVAWDARGGIAGLDLRTPLDLSAGRLELRTVVDPTVGDVRFDVRLTDADGRTATLTPQGGGLVPALPRDRYVGKRWAQAVLVDPAAASGLDTSRVTRVELVGRSPRGHVWVLDVAAAPEALPAVPERRAPTVSLGAVTVREGDGSRPARALVPFTVSGAVTRPAALVVGVLDDIAYPARRDRLRLDLAPGQTSGTVPVTYRPNRTDDFDLRTATLVAFGLRGAVTDRYVGYARVRDDDRGRGSG